MKKLFTNSKDRNIINLGKQNTTTTKEDNKMKMNVRYSINEFLNAVSRTNKKLADEALDYIKSDKEINYSFFKQWHVGNEVVGNDMHYITVTGKENDNCYRAIVEGMFLDGAKVLCYITSCDWRYERKGNKIVQVME